MKVRIYNSVKEDQYIALADVPIDGKPHRVGDLCKPNDPAYPDKVTGNTVYIRDFHGAKLTQVAVCARIPTEEWPLGEPDSEDYDVTEHTITATRVA
ncbi:hypothetical protein A1O7_04835 [Cladophialophora yegresii CBS 114405]|uniref:Uncharacterized protein n=1 Tax=Cladophialophora yegresii CBS 114405 TaxID=1182544 RepID=W9VXW4_9EURO|nr:uncharacterized protein A1O7_04835 [Cladophialophora yegresii CBS 114405]EXJ60682.1 hypothetical protein A1O7_04835 [Cladophialophora yegresii CBS 114405]